MSYEALSKLYYQDADNYEKIYASRYQGENAVQLDFVVSGNPAFYCLTPEIFGLATSIYKEEHQILKLRNELPGIALSQFTRRCLIDEIVLTNSIEGVNSTRRDIDDILDDLKGRDHKKRFQGLVQKYLMLQNDSKLSLSTCEDIRRIYDDLVLKEVCEEDPKDRPDGELFRKDLVYVHSSTQKVIHTGLYPESEIQNAIKKAIAILQDENQDSLIRVSVFHYFIGYIHPFYNGNGRLARFISSYLLARELDPLLSYRLSFPIKENINEYYKAFKICNDPKNRGDITPFIEFFLTIMHKAAEQLHQALYKRKHDLHMYEEYLESFPFVQKNQDLYPLGHALIQAELFSEKGISTQELLELLSISRGTLSSRLDVYRKNGLLSENQDGAKKYYRLNQKTFLQLGGTLLAKNSQV